MGNKRAAVVVGGERRVPPVVGTIAKSPMPTPRPEPAQSPPVSHAAPDAGAERERLREDSSRRANWKRWGPYLSERQWGTVREDYSPDGSAWDYFPHDHARSRAYRWGEDGLLGITDRECRLCFALALWNERDPILKERLFGLGGPEGNHGEDVKEEYFYLDSTPTHSYMKALYRYPQREFPYAELARLGRERTRDEPEAELVDLGLFDEGRWFDVFAEYAKAGPNDVLIRITLVNRGPEPASLHVLPTLWARNSWVWGCSHEGCEIKPHIRAAPGGRSLLADHVSLGQFQLHLGMGADGLPPVTLFTENHTNAQRLFGAENPGRYLKDAFHEYVVHGRRDAVNPRGHGTKAAAHYRLTIPPGGRRELRLRLHEVSESVGAEPLGEAFDEVFAARIAEADAFYDSVLPTELAAAQRDVARQAYAGLLWSKQYYQYIVKDWLEGDAHQPPPPEARRSGRNQDWGHLYSRDVLSMPDKWEYPWFAAWDLAFHAIPLADVDPDLAKSQLVLLLREWYMHPNGQIPAYEFAFADVNPPVHAWAVWRVYQRTARGGRGDRTFLARCFQKLLINFTWWVNRKDRSGHHIFHGGFLGLDNIGVFDRSQPLPGNAQLDQADATAWMAFYCVNMLAIALELAEEDEAYADLASKFFEHFVAIADAMNNLGGTGLWDEADGFYYDRLHLPEAPEGPAVVPLRVRSLVGLLPILAAHIIEEDTIERIPGFAKRLRWFLQHRHDLAGHITWCDTCRTQRHEHLLLAIPSPQRLRSLLQYLLDESEFLSPFGVRSLSKAHADKPFILDLHGARHAIRYTPGESDSGMFGGNSNWRGPVWFPINHLLLEALELYHHFYGDSFLLECPTGSGVMMNLREVAFNLTRRLTGLFEPGPTGLRPCLGNDPRFAAHPEDRRLVLFHEYFHGDTGKGLGASHRTGWTALVASCYQRLARPDL